MWKKVSFELAFVSSNSSSAQLDLSQENFLAMGRGQSNSLHGANSVQYVLCALVRHHAEIHYTEFEPLNRLDIFAKLTNMTQLLQNIWWNEAQRAHASPRNTAPDHHRWRFFYCWETYGAIKRVPGGLRIL